MTTISNIYRYELDSWPMLATMPYRSW